MSILIATPEVGDIFSKTLETIEASLRWHSSSFEFLAILNALLRNTLSKAALLGEYLKSL